MFGVSWDTISPNEVGLVYDKNVQHIELDKVYSSGRYLVGLGRGFIKFPTTYQLLRFGSNFPSKTGGDVVARSKDGLVVNLEVAVQYRLSTTIEDLGRLYYTFGTDYEQVYGRMVLSVVRDVASRHTVFDFWSTRPEISEEMRVELNKAFNDVYAYCAAFELANVEVSQDFANAITDTQVAFQDIQQASYEQSVARVRASATVDVANQVAVILAATANATAQVTFTNAKTEADSLTYRIDQQVDSLSTLARSFNISSPETLLDYLYVTSVQDNSVKNVLLSLQMPALLKR